MKIEHIFVSTWARDVILTRCCVASIRHWYPVIPISLIEDRAAGDFSTREIQDRWNVSVMDTRNMKFAGPYGKLEPLFLDPGSRVMVLDSDIVFLGRVLDRLERFDEDIVVEKGNYLTDENVEQWFYDIEQLRALDPEFDLEERCFNSGHWVANTGLLSRRELEPFLDYQPSRVRLKTNIFRGWDQGLFNYLVRRKAQRGEISLARDGFWRWPSDQLMYEDGCACLGGYLCMRMDVCVWVVLMYEDGCVCLGGAYV